MTLLTSWQTKIKTYFTATLSLTFTGISHNMLVSLFKTLTENPFGAIIVFTIITLCFLYFYYIFKWIRDFLYNSGPTQESGTMSGLQRIDPELDSSIVLVTVETSRNSKILSPFARPSTNSTSGACPFTSTEKSLVTSTQSVPVRTNLPMKAEKSMSNPVVL